MKIQRQLQIEGMTVLLVEHDMELVMSCVDRLIVLDRGAMIAEGWLKPLMFEVSLAIHFGTLALLLGLMAPAARAGRVVCWPMLTAATLAALVVAYIMVQAGCARPRTSTTPRVVKRRPIQKWTLVVVQSIRPVGTPQMSASGCRAIATRPPPRTDYGQTVVC